ncbi:MAG: DNA gyrase C-terminal beta-propeller domain-containing protein, partial [Pseudomonadota bacterium]
ANTHDLILLFTNTGRVYCKRVYEIPQGNRTSRGKAIVNLLELRKGERVRRLLSIKEIQDGHFVVMATRNGLIKKTQLTDFANIRATGIIAIDLEPQDALNDVDLTDGNKHIFLNTQQGMSIRFHEKQVRAMGRTAKGVRGITLRENDAMMGMAILDPESNSYIATVCENGFGKRTVASEFSIQHRGGIGVISIKTTERNGLVVGSQVVEEDDELMLITALGKVIRMPVEDISSVGRNTQGVRLIRLEDNERVVAVERLAEKADDTPSQEVETSSQEDETSSQEDYDTPSEDVS